MSEAPPTAGATADPERTGRVLLINGPNLDLLGHRDPAVYGTDTLDTHVTAARTAAKRHGMDLDHVQSNHEGVIVDTIGAARGTYRAIVINGGAFTHYAWAISDALAAFDGTVIEVHLSNPGAREAWRHTSVLTPVADGVIAGLGGLGYVLAIDAIDAIDAIGAGDPRG